ncbi:hypothetical protein NEDG_01707 [Nematocida displodere]|uniref:Uncharacterized protein n=1 Tax=Nematocida displodere TaxID=1805483 RepID=A0A177EDT2_9MICR|nr:hypothetical protein NEDG_01707 [Nematocida displodere]
MRPKTHFFTLLVIVLLVMAGVLTLLLITTTPRSVAYDVVSVDSGEDVCDLDPNWGTEKIQNIEDARDIENTNRQSSRKLSNQMALSLYDVLYEFGVIRTSEDLDDSDFENMMYDTLAPYTDNPGDIEMTMLYQIAPDEVVSTREYMHFQTTTTRELLFMESQETPYNLRISAYNYNLRTRQTAVFVFFKTGNAIKGLVLNNVWLRPRNITFINTLIKTNNLPFLITDLDYNVSTNFSVICPAV